MALTVEIKVVPSSGKQQCKLDKSGILKCYLKSAPERGLANAELVKMLAHALALPQNAVEIIAGQTIRNKKIKIHTQLTYDQLLSKLGIEKQLKLLE